MPMRNEFRKEGASWSTCIWIWTNVSRSTVTRWNSEGEPSERRMKRGTRGGSLEKGRVGSMEGDRSSGQTDGKTDRRLETAHYGRRMREECGGSALFDTINIGSAGVEEGVRRGRGEGD